MKEKCRTTYTSVAAQQAGSSTLVVDKLDWADFAQYFRSPGGDGAGVCHLWIIIIIINTWVKRDGVGLRAVWFGNWVGVWV